MESPSISLNALEANLSTKWLGRPLFLYDQLTSTNSHAIELAETSGSHGTVVLAEYQTAGKGRFGREWHSPANLNIYFSVILTQHPLQPFTPWIPLATGIAMAETVKEIAGLNVSLKWPNDLLVHTQKLGGILCETTTKGPNGKAIIVGVGININSLDIHFPAELKEIATSLAIQSGRPFDRHILLTSFFQRLEFYYDRVFDSDLSPLHSNYVSRCSTLGRHVEVRLPGDKVIAGIASLIGKEGELHVTPTDPLVGSMPHKEVTPVVIRAGDVIHLR